MKAIEWLRDFFSGNKEITLRERRESACRQLEIEAFAVEMAVHLIASTISKCEFKTIINGKEVKGYDWYRWNVEPNLNQNSSEFMQQLIERLLIRNDCLIIEEHGQFFVVDEFTRNESTFYQDTFTNVSVKGLSLNKTYYSGDIIYLKYSSGDISALLHCLMGGYSDLLTMAVGKYKRAGGRKGFFKLGTTKTNDKNFQERLDKMFNSQMRAFYEAENASIALPNGIDYQDALGEGSKKSTSEVKDIADITKEAIDRIAQTFKIPPALLSGNIADVGGLVDVYLTFCIDPLVDLIQTEVNRKIYKKAGAMNGSRILIDTTCIKHIDIFSNADKTDKLISGGMYSIDDLLALSGRIPLNTWWSKTHWMTKNYTSIETIGKGGEKDVGDQEERRGG